MTQSSLFDAIYSCYNLSAWIAPFVNHYTKTIELVLQDVDMLDKNDQLVRCYADVPEYVLNWLDKLPDHTDDMYDIVIMNQSDLD